MPEPWVPIVILTNDVAETVVEESVAELGQLPGVTGGHHADSRGGPWGNDAGRVGHASPTPLAAPLVAQHGRDCGVVLAEVDVGVVHALSTAPLGSTGDRRHGQGVGQTPPAPYHWRTRVARRDIVRQGTALRSTRTSSPDSRRAGPHRFPSRKSPFSPGGRQAPRHSSVRALPPWA